jgi:ATP-dependent DNA helicase RecG
MILQSVKTQLKGGEGIHTEFISEVDNLDSIAKTVCAFLNTEGGTIFCGVDGKGKIVGIEVNDQLLKAIHSYLLEKITPKALVTVNCDEEEGKSLLSIEVPEGKDRPYLFSDRVFVRQKSQTRTADSATLRNMIQTKSITAERWERRPSVAMEETDLDKEEVFQTASEARQAGRFSFSDEHDHISILEELAVCNAKGFTQAADVLFAAHPSMRHPQTRARVTLFESDKGSDEYIDDQMLEGPLVKVFNDVFSFIARNIKQRARFDSNEVRREDRSEYPMDALREGLVNAFAHRDYAGFSGGITVGIYPNRIEIWNSGHLPEGMKPGDLRKNHPSLPTNPDIAHVLYLRGLMERIGRGTQKIINSCRDYSLPTPQWKDGSTGVTLTLRAKASDEERPFVANARQMVFLEQVLPDEALSPGDYHLRFAEMVSERQSRRDLKELEVAGLVLREGGGAATLYRRTNRTLEEGNRT